MATYRYGGFTPEDARQLSGVIATITTHTDPETDQPGETIGPCEVRYVDGKRSLMLLAPRTGKSGEQGVERVVFLLDVAAVDVHKTMECRNCKGVGRVDDVRTASITHRATTIRRKCRYCEGSGKISPLSPAVEPSSGEIPAWMLGWDDE